MEAVGVGDSEHDIRSAHAAGLATVAACWGTLSRNRLLAAKPDFLAERPEWRAPEKPGPAGGAAEVSEWPRFNLQTIAVPSIAPTRRGTSRQSCCGSWAANSSPLRRKYGTRSGLVAGDTPEEAVRRECWTRKHCRWNIAYGEKGESGPCCTPGQASLRMQRRNCLRISRFEARTLPHGQWKPGRPG